MQVEQIKDILDWLSKYHHQMSLCYDRSANRSESSRIKMLLSYLAEHEQSLADAVAKYEKIADSQVLNTWCYEYMDHKPDLAEALCSTDLDQLSLEQIVSRCVAAHDELIVLYRYLLGRSDTDRLKELFENLIQLEQNESMRMVRDTSSYADL
ncbi:ATPase [Marinobacterium arenosum]|uniref:ATPase n=1 Tax=Marinobacterium arenosum TaxID=2862496 RepID=UPI001C984E5F|nr:ATPase [Marinobacterium arenosum]MBY4678565.1 ATPase [Marinobacterium arenosum]